ncbi:rhodanese-like domain-containing protein [Alphaproteobacteria bacterium]|nr:rhodanese-like domain-containing protein [Alphaproteobacteria bacterium]
MNVKALEAFNFLSENLNSHLIDTRSDLEWKTTGIPDLSSINKETHLVNWGPVLDQSFFEKFQRFLLFKFNQKDSLFFICRSGSRSLMAAQFAIKFGFKKSFNISEGFYNDNDQNWIKNLPIKFI